MFEEISTRLKNIEDGYSAAIEVAGGIFQSVKSKEYKMLPDLTKFQTELMGAIKKEKDGLKQVIEKIASQKGILESRLQNLLPLFPQEQKESVLDMIKSLSFKEAELEKSLFLNQQYLEALVSSQKAMVDSVVSITGTENNEHPFFLNKKF